MVLRNVWRMGQAVRVGEEGGIVGTNMIGEGRGYDWNGKEDEQTWNIRDSNAISYR